MSVGRNNYSLPTSASIGRRGPRRGRSSPPSPAGIPSSLGGGTPGQANDTEARVMDPALSFTVPAAPTWSAAMQQFAGGATTVCDVRTQLVTALAAVPTTSPAVGAADPAQRPSTDVLGKQRPNPATLGAFEP